MRKDEFPAFRVADPRSGKSIPSLGFTIRLKVGAEHPPLLRVVRLQKLGDQVAELLRERLARRRPYLYIDAG